MPSRSLKKGRLMKMYSKSKEDGLQARVLTGILRTTADDLAVVRWNGCRSGALEIR